MVREGVILLLVYVLGLVGIKAGRSMDGRETSEGKYEGDAIGYQVAMVVIVLAVAALVLGHTK